MLEAQKEFDKVVRTDEAFNYKYAPLDKVIEATRKGLASNGLVIMQFPINEEDRVGVKTIVAHTSGEIIESQYSTSSYKKDPQGVGALLTYLRRYAYMAVCGIAPEDDDGVSAMPITNKIVPESLTDTIPFGKHKGKKWEDVPNNYLLWLIAQERTTPQIREKATQVLESKNVKSSDPTDQWTQ